MSASHKKPPPSCAIVIFGANGDLTKRLIVPALYNLAKDGGSVVVARLNPGLSLTESVSLLEKTFKQYAPDAPFDYRFVDVEYGRKFGREDLAFVVLEKAL